MNRIEQVIWNAAFAQSVVQLTLETSKRREELDDEKVAAIERKLPRIAVKNAGLAVEMYRRTQTEEKPDNSDATEEPNSPKEPT